MADSWTPVNCLSKTNKDDVQEIEVDDEGDDAEVYRDCTTAHDRLGGGNGVCMATMLQGFVLAGPESRGLQILDEIVDRECGLRRREIRRRRSGATIQVPRASGAEDESCSMNMSHIARGCDRPWNRPSKAFCDCMYPPVVVEHPVTVNRQIETYREVIGR